MLPRHRRAKLVHAFSDGATHLILNRRLKEKPNGKIISLVKIYDRRDQLPVSLSMDDRPRFAMDVSPTSGWDCRGVFESKHIENLLLIQLPNNLKQWYCPNLK